MLLCVFCIFEDKKENEKVLTFSPQMLWSCVVRPPRAAAARGVVLKRAAEEKSSKRGVFWAQKPSSSFTSSSFWVCASHQRARDQSPLLRQSLFEIRRFQNCEMEKGTARFVKKKREEEEEKEEDVMAAARFSDETGEALNEAAFRLIREATKEDATTLEEDRLNAKEEEESSSSSLKWIETVKITPGRHKYVLIDVYNERNERKLIVRSYANCGYHADNYRVGMRELRDDSHFSRSGGVRGRVVGGGRIEYDPESKSVNVYGYSMTFGRTPGCNKKTMEIIQREMGLVHAQWSDDGY